MTGSFWGIGGWRFQRYQNPCHVLLFLPFFSVVHFGVDSTVYLFVGHGAEAPIPIV